jgi:hypothetical protein
VIASRRILRTLLLLLALPGLLFPGGLGLRSCICDGFAQMFGMDAPVTTTACGCDRSDRSDGEAPAERTRCCTAIELAPIDTGAPATLPTSPGDFAPAPPPIATLRPTPSSHCSRPAPAPTPSPGWRRPHAPLLL